MAEPTVPVPVPVSLMQELHDAAGTADGPAVAVQPALRAARAVAALLSQPTLTAEPAMCGETMRTSNYVHECVEDAGHAGQHMSITGIWWTHNTAIPTSVADMVPATTFIGRFRAPDDADEDHFTVMDDFWVRASNTRWSVQSAIDPSTIRDVTPPSVTP